LGPVEVSSIQLVKGTMLETGAGGPGGGPVPPFYQPGIVDKLFEPLWCPGRVRAVDDDRQPGPLCG
jgi:hypothetical protein